MTTREKLEEIRAERLRKYARENEEDRRREIELEKEQEMCDSNMTEMDVGDVYDMLSEEEASE